MTEPQFPPSPEPTPEPRPEGHPAHEPHKRKGPPFVWRRRIVWVCVMLFLVSAGAAVVAFMGGPWNQSEPGKHAGAAPEAGKPLAVKTVRPRRDTSFRLTVPQLAFVEPFLEAELRARVAGVVRFVPKEIGEHVRQGELLVEIDVPDLWQDVLQKESVVEQRRKELSLARVKVKDAEAQIEVAKAGVLQRKAEVKQAAANRDFKQLRLTRFEELGRRNSISDDVVEEQKRDALAAAAGLESAHVAVTKAQADQTEKEVNLEAARADVELKEALVAVAARDLDRARALSDYARLTAPFDGIVVRRNVDVGDFVQNAERGQADPLMTVARTDIVTIYGKLPDKVAPFISRNTTVQLLMDDLPGVTIEGRVTRFAPAIQSQDRTMRVEVDLFNGSLNRWQKLESRMRDEAVAVLAGSNPLTTAALVGLGEAGWSTLRKGASEELPTYPRTNGKEGSAQALLMPGMTGTMRVELRQFGGGCLLPAGALFNSGGKSYVLQVIDGVTRLVPVRVQVNDGVLAKVVIVENGQEPRELTGTEEIVRTRQAEIGEGRRVVGAVEPW